MTAMNKCRCGNITGLGSKYCVFCQDTIDKADEKERLWNAARVSIRNGGIFSDDQQLALCDMLDYLRRALS